MKLAHLRTAVLVLLLVACAPARPGWRSRAIELPSLEGARARPERLILVSVAGLTPATYRGEPPAMPVVAQLALHGVSADHVEPVAPPTAYPAHATLVTGEPPSVHGIVADRVLGDVGVRNARFWHASQLRVPTLWQRAGEARLRVASLAWPTTLGASIELLIPDLEPTRRGESWYKLIESASTPELLKRVRAHGGERQEMDLEGDARDGVLVDVACDLLASGSPPDLLLLRISGAIPAIALTGAESPAAHEALGRADARVGRLLACLRKAGLGNSSALAVVGDHGTVPIHTAIRVNELLANEGLLNGEQWRAILRSNGGSAFLYARDETSAIQARRTLELEAVRTGTYRIVSAEKMLGLDADPAAWFGLEAELGYAFAYGTGAPLLSAAASLATGGYLLHPERMSGGLVMWGAGVREGVRVPQMEQMDIAPTLAQLLGIDMGEIEGHALVGVVWPERRGRSR